MKQILQAWDDCTEDLSVQTLIAKLQDWVKRGLVDKQVWQDIDELVNFTIPTPTVTADVSLATVPSTKSK